MERLRERPLARTLRKRATIMSDETNETTAADVNEELDDAFACPERFRALMEHLEEDPAEYADWDEDVRGLYGEGYSYRTGFREYMVLTDEEADVAWDAALESYVDDCLEIPDEIRPYFDMEKWKADARHDGRGHALSGYDGDEADGKDPVTGETFVIFRTN
jgi:hypothetical protein